MVTPVDPANPTSAEIFEYLKVIDAKLDELRTMSIGSWQWDKSAGIVTYFDTQGAEAFKFAVKDDAESASQERRQDLEI